MNSRLIAINVITLLALAIVFLRGQGAGPLNPPAAPADGVYRTLEEIYDRALAAEAVAAAANSSAQAAIAAANAAADSRTPITDADLPLTISQSGAYYLVENLEFTSGFTAITINVADVTIDMRGFTLSSAAVIDGDGIRIGENAHRTVVCNGTITGTTTVTTDGSNWTTSPGGFRHGIYTSQSGSDTAVDYPRQCRFENLTVSACRQHGLLGGHGAIITKCTAERNGAGGLACMDGVISESTARFNGDLPATINVESLGGGFTLTQVAGITGHQATVTNCNASFNGKVGINAQRGSVENCAAKGNGLDGIDADRGDVAHCVATSNGAGGIIGSTVSACTARFNDTTGIEGTTVMQCTAASNATGFLVTNGVLAFSTAQSNTTNFDAASSQLTGNRQVP